MAGWSCSNCSESINGPQADVDQFKSSHSCGEVIIFDDTGLE